MELFQVIAVLAALALGGWGFLTLNEATQGVGFIGLAILLAALARIAQAARHQAQVRDIARAQLGIKDKPPYIPSP